MHHSTKFYKPVLVQLLENPKSIRIVKPPSSNIRTLTIGPDLSTSINLLAQFEDLFFKRP